MHFNLNKCIDNCQTAKIFEEREESRVVEAFAAFKKNIRSTKRSSECKFCVKRHSFKKDPCHAWKKSSMKCLKRNRFLAKFMSSTVHMIEDAASNSNDSLINAINIHYMSEKTICANMVIESIDAELQLNWGAAANIMPRIFPQTLPLKLTKTGFRMWNNSAVIPLGQTGIQLTNQKSGENVLLDFSVVKEDFITRF